MRKATNDTIIIAFAVSMLLYITSDLMLDRRRRIQVDELSTRIDNLTRSDTSRPMFEFTWEVLEDGDHRQENSRIIVIGDE